MLFVMVVGAWIQQCVRRIVADCRLGFLGTGTAVVDPLGVLV